MDQPAHALKGSSKIAAVLIFMCVLTSQLSCGLGNKVIKRTIQQIQTRIQTSLGHLPTDGLLSGVSCSSLNMTELLGIDELPPHRGQILSLFRCHTSEASSVTKELAPQLLAISQLSQDVEGLLAESVSHSNCSLPHFQQDKDKYQFVRCLLELLDQVLSFVF